MARAARAAERLPRLGTVARDPHRLSDRLREPDPRRGPLGVELPDARPGIAPDHRVAAHPRHRGTGAAGVTGPAAGGGRPTQPRGGWWRRIVLDVSPLRDL